MLKQCCGGGGGGGGGCDGGSNDGLGSGPRICSSRSLTSVLPALRMVFLEPSIEEVVVEARGRLLRHGDRLRVLLQLRHVLRRVPSLQGVQVAVASVLALPQ